MLIIDRTYSKDYPGGSRAATLSQIRQARGRFDGFGETGEFTLAQRKGDQIVFHLRHRHSSLDTPEPVPWDSNRAEPMRRALSGQSGTLLFFRITNPMLRQHSESEQRFRSITTLAKDAIVVADAQGKVVFWN